MGFLSKLMCGVIPAYHTDSQHDLGPANATDLYTSLDRRYKKLRKEGSAPDICYALALHAGIAGRTIRPVAAAEVMGKVKTGGNYGHEYQRMMGITGSGSANFLSQNIHESGILNFKDIQGNNLVHTAYLHRTTTGELILLHNNGPMLDLQMQKNNKVALLHGGMNIYTNIEGLQLYLDTGYRFYFTPVSQLNAEVS